MKLWSDDEKPRQLYIVLIRYISTQLTIVNSMLLAIHVEDKVRKVISTKKTMTINER